MTIVLEDVVEVLSSHLASGEKWRVPPGHLIVLPTRGDTLPNGLLASYRQDYPQGGFCIASGTPEVDRGEFVLLEVESQDVAANYYQLFEILLEDQGETHSVLCDPEIEPIFVERIEKSRASGESRRFTVRAIDGEGWQFDTSDVLTYQWVEGNSPAWSLLYPLRVKMWVWDGTLYYTVPVESVLGVLESW